MVAVVLGLIFYVISKNLKSEGETFSVRTNVNQPLDRVYSQFSNLQNFAEWNTFFTQNPDFQFRFFSPYEGQGSAMTYKNLADDDEFGEVFIRFAMPKKAVRYHIYSADSEKPVVLDVKFTPQMNTTDILWSINIPGKGWWERSGNLTAENIRFNIDSSTKNLASTLGNKVQKEQERENIKFDSLIIEQSPGRLLLGVNVSTRNTKDLLFKNIILNHNKTLNYITSDLAKKNDEYGEPVLITDADSYTDKEVSYYYGIPLSKRIGISDNNFTFRTLNASRNYVVYYRGAYSGRVKAIQQILSQAKRDTLRTGELQQTFIEEPTAESNVLLKLAVPVFR